MKPECARGKAFFLGFWRKLPAFLNAGLDGRTPRPKQRSLRQTPHAAARRHVWKRESRLSGLFLYGFEEKSPPALGERWFRRTGTKPRYGALKGKDMQYL
jgi:hypothetical protein